MLHATRSTRFLMTRKQFPLLARLRRSTIFGVFRSPRNLFPQVLAYAGFFFSGVYQP